MGTIGVAREYNAYIVNGLTGQVIAALPWSRISWSRLANDVSAASLTVPAADGGIECTGAFGGLRAWTQLLAIERNGAIVWDGPVVGWSRPASKQGGMGELTVRALDRFAITMKRLVQQDHLGRSRAGILFWDLLDEAELDDTSGVPYVFTIPASTEFFSSNAQKVSINYEVERLERIYDAVQNLVSRSLVDYTQVCGTLWPDETTRRDLLGERGQRPVLGEHNVLGIPGIEVDGTTLATVAYGGAASTGKSGAAVISTKYPVLGDYTSAILHIGEQFSDISTIDASTDTTSGYSKSLDGATTALAVLNSVPVVTIEQVRLAPNFGCAALESDLSNLIPGVRVDVDFQDTAAFQQPFVGLSNEYRFWFTQDGVGDIYDYLQTPVSSDSISVLRLERLDVNVTATDDGVDEEILASFIPTAEWDGTVPEGWEDTAADPLLSEVEN